MERLERIDGLRQEDAPAGVLLEEVRALLSEAEDWVREEDVPERAVNAIERSKAALAAGEAAKRQDCSQPASSENRRKTGEILFAVREFPAQWLRAGLHEHRSNWRHVMGLTRLLLRPHTREQESEESPNETPPMDEPTRQASVIAFANQKGGVAKTTSTLNLAAALAEEGHRVLCVDMDPQGNLTMSQGLNPDSIERSMFDVLVHRLPIENVITNTEIDLAVSSIDLAGAELALSSMIGRERALEKALLPMKGTYDYVLIDTPPSLGLLTINALVAADHVIVPVQCEYLSLRGLVQLENTLAMIRENLNPNVAIMGILPTMFDRRTLHAREAVEILEENFGDLVFKTRIKKTIRYAEAPVKGTSVLKYDPTGNAANAYRDLAKEVLNGAKARQHA